MLTILSFTAVEAQYRNGYPYYGRQNSLVPRSDDPKEEAKPLTAEEIVAEQMPAITEAADLNDFEHAVVSSILTKYIQQTIELRILDLDPNKTKESLEIIRRKQNEELKAGLPEDKYDLLMEIQEKGSKKVKSERKKKKKKKDEKS